MRCAPVLPGSRRPVLLCTGWYCASKAGIQQHVSSYGGASVALVGCGPVGLMSLLAAQALGAAQVPSQAQDTSHHALPALVTTLPTPHTVQALRLPWLLVRSFGSAAECGCC